MSDETKPNVRIRAHGRDWQEQTANDQVHKVLSEALAQTAQNLIEEAVEQALDLAFKAHGSTPATQADMDHARAWMMDHGVVDPGQTEPSLSDVAELAQVSANERNFREWLKPVREEAAKELDLSPTVRLFIAKYLNPDA